MKAIYAPLIGGFLLTACSTQPVVTVETVRVPTWIPAPVTLTTPVTVVITTQDTWGSAVGRLSSGLQACNANLQAIATLKAPPPKNP